jgi:hypothetical protein
VRRRELNDVTEAPKNHVLAQWAYSELLTRHEYEYYNYLQGLMTRKAQGTSFDDLVRDEQALLVQAWEDVRGGQTVFAAALQNVQTFQLMEWTRDKLGDVYVIPHFVLDMSQNQNDTVTFRNWIRADPIRPLHQTHARYAFYRASLPGADDPGLVGQLGGFEHLLDGYHRAVRFWYTRPNTQFRVWQPIP